MVLTHLSLFEAIPIVFITPELILVSIYTFLQLEAQRADLLFVVCPFTLVLFDWGNLKQ